MEKHTLIAVDLAKSVFEVAVSHEDGKVRNGDGCSGRCSSGSSPTRQRRR